MMARQLELVDADALRERSLLGPCIHAVSEAAGNRLETRPAAGIGLDELAARVAFQVADTVRRADVPNVAGLERLLAWHVDRGEVERDENGRWRLAPDGLEAFAGLLEPDPRGRARRRSLTTCIRSHTENMETSTPVHARPGVHVGAYVPATLAQALRDRAADELTNSSTVIRRPLRDYLQERDRGRRADPR